MLHFTSQPAILIVIMLTAAIAWGWAYPLIKMGMRDFGILPDMTGSKMLFAGIRFFISGLIILAIAKPSHRKFGIRKSSDVWFILLYSLLNTTLHYAFFYFGLSHNAGARSAILNSMSVFTVVILALNLGGKDSGRFTFLGDGMIILLLTLQQATKLQSCGKGSHLQLPDTCYKKKYTMQILLASAKIMNSSSSIEVPLMSEPTYKEQANKFGLELSFWDTKHLMKELKCSQAIALENQQRYQSFWNESEQKPAILAYFGQAYKYLKAETFSQEEFSFAQEHLFITSFLYGLLRPLDKIHPYRMEGKVKLEAANGENLFSFWKPLLTDRLIEMVKADDGILIHLATEEFEHLFDWKRVKEEMKVIQPLFYVDKGDTIKVVSVHAKSCRGAMTRYIIQNRLSHPANLLSFELDGFKYNQNYGDELHPHFIKR